MFTLYKTWHPIASPFDPCKPILEKTFSTPPNLYIGFQPPNLPQFYTTGSTKGRNTMESILRPLLQPIRESQRGNSKMKQIPPEYYQIMEQLQTVDFVLVELTLYLDTHPDDLEAIKQFNHYAKERKTIKKAFESQFGPLIAVWQQLFWTPMELERTTMAVASLNI